MLVSTFHLGTICIGVDILLVREINRSMEFSPIPGAPNYILGMLNIRGRIITLFDLKKRFSWSQEERKRQDGTGKESPGEPRKQYNVIMKSHNEVMRISRRLADSQCTWEDPVGLVVDRLGDVRQVSDDHILPPPANLKGIAAPFIRGVVRVDKELLVILNVAKIFGSDGMSGDQAGDTTAQAR
ncbi:MAG: chemotaxis protein CheW [Magnetococcales bacterium]|nr:chemotaxis protein CheW [Magnetococcales bacterium]MBF0583064.1 chemotaxis protein CheW [Magnetococcales bacterium]